MAQTLETGYVTYLKEKLEPADTEMEVAVAPTVTKGRLYLKNGWQEEWIEFDGVSGTTLQTLARNLSKTSDPATTWTWKTRLAWTQVELVVMHDQLWDKLEWQQYKLEWLTYATTAARDADLWGDGVATKAWILVYISGTWVFYNYNLSAWQWESVDSGTVTTNATTTASGKVELGTQAQHDAWDSTDGWNPIVPTSDVIQVWIQKGSALYAWVSAVGTDAYAVTMTPTLTAYTTGMNISFKADVANTGACTIDIDSLWVKNIKLADWDDPTDSSIVENQLVNLKYDWTNFVLTNPSRVMASDSEATTWTSEVKLLNTKQAKDNYESRFHSFTITKDISDATGTDQYAHWAWFTPSYFSISTYTNSWCSRGSYDGSNDSSVWFWNYLTSWDHFVSSSYSVGIAYWSHYQTWVVSAVDWTNIDIDWTKVWTPTGSYYILVECYA